MNDISSENKMNDISDENKINDDENKMDDISDENNLAASDSHTESKVVIKEEQPECFAELHCDGNDWNYDSMLPQEQIFTTIFDPSDSCDSDSVKIEDNHEVGKEKFGESDCEVKKEIDYEFEELEVNVGIVEQLDTDSSCGVKEPEKDISDDGETEDDFPHHNSGSSEKEPFQHLEEMASQNCFMSMKEDFVQEQENSLKISEGSSNFTKIKIVKRFNEDGENKGNQKTVQSLITLSRIPPKKKPQEDKDKRKKISLEVKRKIIEKRERGVSVTDLARTYNRSTSTICTILKDKDKIKKIDASKGVTRISTQRLRVLDDVERFLLIWINEKQMQGDSINESIIREKAKVIFADLVKKAPGASTNEEEAFKASRGWFEKFKRRTGIHSVVRHGEAASSDTKATENFIGDFKRLVDSEGYLPQQVFNCDETGLFWKKMPKRTYITAEEKALPGHKPMKDRLTLLFCANASGDLKVKPMLVYHSENPRAFKKYKVQKSRLTVMWRSNNKAWVTRELFTDWINEVFGPSVKNYLLEMNLPLHVLLVMDNAPAHPPDVEDDLLEEFKFIKIQFLPPNTTPLLQPMDQQVISNFKKLYTKALFERCFEATEGNNLTLREFWKDHMNIVTCLKMIDKAWEGVTKRTLISAWKKLWPDCVVERDFEPVLVELLVDEIVSLAKTMGLEVDNNDIDELVEEHSQELTTEELMELHSVTQKEVVEEVTASDEQQPSSAIREMLKAWEDVASYIEKHHPNKAVAMRATNLFNDNAMSHFRQILKRRQKQMTRELSSEKGF